MATEIEEPSKFVDETNSALLTRGIIMAEVGAVRALMSSSIVLFFFETFLIS